MVIVGFGKQKKASVVGAISSVKPESFKDVYKRQVKSLCEYVCRRKDNGTESYGLENCLPRQGDLIQSYNEILREYDKT